MLFREAYDTFWRELGTNRTMVLATSLHDAVTARMMSFVILDGKFYFQTDRTSRKYNQLRSNANVSICADNIQIEGRCVELGRPADDTRFCAVYREHFPNAYTRYSLLTNERLFDVTPTFIERWRYLDGIPYIESFHVENKHYLLERYQGI